MKKHTKILSLGLCIVFVVLSIAISPVSAEGDFVPSKTGAIIQELVADPNAVYQDTITIGVANDVTTLDPQASNTDANMMAFELTHETLVQIDPATGEIVPGLAESWEVSEDGLIFTFALPSGVLFTDGVTPFTANDVKYTYTRAKDSSFASAKVSDVVDINVIDDAHIAITLSRPNQEFLLLMAHKGMSILSEALCTADETNGPTIGTGMFAVEEWAPGDFISFVRNENYRGGKAPTRHIVFKLFKEASTRLIALQAGEIDVCIDPSTIDLGYIQDDSNLQLIQTQNVVMLYVAINTTKPGLDNVHIRKALAYATDKLSMIEVGFDGKGTVHNNYINVNQFGLKKDIAVYEYNLEKAKEEFALSGYKEGELTFHVMTDKEYKKNAALVLQADLSEIGINLVIDEMETAALKSTLNDPALNYELCIYQWTDADGTDFTVRNMYGSSMKDGVLVKNGSNRCVLTDATLNGMIDAALVEIDTSKREQLYFAIEDYLNEIVPIVPICTSYINIGIKKDITGAVWRPTAKHDYRFICIPEK